MSVGAHVRQGPGVAGVTLGIERPSEMRPGFWHCAILQCDTTRIGQDAPCGAMPKLIHLSIPGPWSAPSLAPWKTWQVLDRQGGAWAGRCTWPNKEVSRRAGSTGLESSLVKSSRVEPVSQSFGAINDLLSRSEMGAEFHSKISKKATHRGTPAPTAIPCTSLQVPGGHWPSASPGRTAGLSDWTPRHKAHRHAARNWPMFALPIWAVRYISQGDTPTPRTASVCHDWTMSHNKPQVHTEWQVVASDGPHLSPFLTNFVAAVA